MHAVGDVHGAPTEGAGGGGELFQALTAQSVSTLQPLRRFLVVAYCAILHFSMVFEYLNR
jgi:hypothetical protein